MAFAPALILDVCYFFCFSLSLFLSLSLSLSLSVSFAIYTQNTHKDLHKLYFTHCLLLIYLFIGPFGHEHTFWAFVKAPMSPFSTLFSLSLSLSLPLALALLSTDSFSILNSNNS